MDNDPLLPSPSKSETNSNNNQPRNGKKQGTILILKIQGSTFNDGGINGDFPELAEAAVRARSSHNIIPKLLKQNHCRSLHFPLCFEPNSIIMCMVL